MRKFFGYVWKGLDGLRKTLHLLFLLLIFGFIVGGLSGSIPKIPKKAALEMRRLLEEGDGEPLIGFTKNLMIFRKSGLLLTSRLMEGNYPNYQQVIPKDGGKKISVNRLELESALRRFKRKVLQADIIKETKRHSFYLKPGEKKRVKAALARKRNRKKRTRDTSTEAAR